MVGVVEGDCASDFDAEPAMIKRMSANILQRKANRSPPTVFGRVGSGRLVRLGAQSAVPFGNLATQLGVAAAADQFDLVCHLGGHGERDSGRRRRASGTRFSLLVRLQQRAAADLLAGNPAAGQVTGLQRVPGGSVQESALAAVGPRTDGWWEDEVATSPIRGGRTLSRRPGRLTLPFRRKVQRKTSGVGSRPRSSRYLVGVPASRPAPGLFVGTAVIDSRDRVALHVNVRA